MRFAVLVIGVAATMLSGCSGLGRKINQALPEFLRAEPGKEEIERLSIRRRVIERTPEELAAARSSFEEAKALFETDRFEEAARRFEEFLESYPDTPFDAEARYLLIRAQIADDEYVDAREQIKEFLGRYPVSEYSDEVEEIMYRMALSYLSGEQSAFIFSNRSDGVAILKDLTLHFPNGRYADDAYWELANHYFDDEDWVEAQTAYDTLVEKYSDSPWAGRALYNRGLTRMMRVKGVEYDEQNMLDAVKDFTMYIEMHPEGDRVEDAKANKSALMELLGEKQVRIAEWYIGRDQERGARFYLVYCQRMYPDTVAAVRAKALLSELPPEGPGDVGAPEGDRPAASPEESPAGAGR